MPLISSIVSRRPKWCYSARNVGKIGVEETFVLRTGLIFPSDDEANYHVDSVCVCDPYFIDQFLIVI